jgi:ABC-type sugar transport system substrate-binding protein
MDSQLFFITHGGDTDDFWPLVRVGVEAARRDLRLNVVYHGARGRFSLDDLVANLDTAIASKAAGIAVTVPAPDDKNLKKSFQTARNAGIPVVAVNVPDFADEKTRVPYAFYVGMNEYACGCRLADRLLAEFAPSKPSKALVIIHESPHHGLEKRFQGIESVLKAHGVVAQRLVTGPEIGTIYSEIKQILAADTAIQAVFTLGTLGTKPVLQLFDDDKAIAERIKLASVDRYDATYREIRSGRLVCTAEQSPFFQGYLPIYILGEHVRSGKKRLEGGDIYLGPIIVDRFNISAMIENDVLLGYYDQTAPLRGSTSIERLRQVALILRGVAQFSEGLRDILKLLGEVHGTSIGR